MIKALARRTLESLLPLALPVHYRIPDGTPTVYLTFDDGPTRHTLRILELLDRHSATATFFVLGSRVAGNDDVLRAIHASGHAIGNHSFAHCDSRAVGSVALRDDLARCNAAIQAEVPGWKPHLYRPPFGHLSAGYIGHAVRKRARIVMWSRDSKDYSAASPETIGEALRNVVPGDIVLFHDEFSVTLQALAWLIPYYLDRGLRLAGISPDATPVHRCPR